MPEARRRGKRGKPEVDFHALPKAEPDSGTTNIRNTESAYWRRWLEPEHRCLAPMTSFSEYDTVDGKKVPVWFARDESRPLMAFVGIWTNWTSTRKVKEGEPNAVVAPIHPKAMPVILTDPGNGRVDAGALVRGVGAAEAAG